MVDIGGVGDSRAETAIDCDNCEIDNVTSGIESREVGDISVDTTVVGVSDSRAEAAIDDVKCEVEFCYQDNIGILSKVMIVSK